MEQVLGNLSKTFENGDGNVGNTLIKLITEDKKRT